MPLATPHNAGCRGKCVFGYRCDSGQNKTHTFSKREQKYFSAYHKHLALMQPVCTTVSTPCHPGWGLAGHPRCVSVGNDYGKTRLYSSIRSKTTALPQCARHHSAQRAHPSARRRGDESAGKRSHKKRSHTMHGCSSLPSATDGNPHTQLPWWLAHSGPVADGLNIAQNPPPQLLRLPGAQTI